MQDNKENERRRKAITRIPLPVAPLPALPKHLVEGRRSNSKDGIQNERHPLRAIGNDEDPQLSLPGPSKEKNMSSLKPKNMLILDTRFVTERSNRESQWSRNACKDNKKRHHRVIIINDEEIEESVKKDVVKKHENKAVTPFKSTLEPNRVKNIKRSLKRPHSRELQGLSPITKEQKVGEERARRKLTFNESVQDQLRSPDFWKKAYMKCVCADDMFEHLLNSETKVGTPRISSTTRACALNWLMKVNGANGNPATIQTACWYLDSVLSTFDIQAEKLQLIAATCYWIALKLLGPGMHARHLVKFSNNAFTTKSLIYAEKVVMMKLGFTRHPVVAQDFITYLSWWCDNDHPGEIEVGATFLCMSGVMIDKTLGSENYPSVIAAAAVMNALVLLRKDKLLPRLKSCPVFKSAEKKAENFPRTCAWLRHTACAIGSVAYEYKVPLDHYGVPPHNIAQKILRAATKQALLEARNTVNAH